MAGTGEGTNPCEVRKEESGLSDKHLDPARTALARLLTENPALKADRDYHQQFIAGYGSALGAAERNEAAVPAEGTTYEGFRTGYRTALLDIGLEA